MNRWEMEKKIVMKALKDPAFKQKLISHPKEALKECFKNEKRIDPSLFDKLTIKIAQEKQGEWTLSLPYLSQKQGNLSDAELEKLFAAVCNDQTYTFCC